MKDVTSFLLTSPEGHVLIDGGYPGNADSIGRNVKLLGFNLKDIKILLNSHGHLHHAGGLSKLQKVLGAAFWTNAQEAGMIASGGFSNRQPFSNHVLDVMKVMRGD